MGLGHSDYTKRDTFCLAQVINIMGGIERRHLRPCLTHAVGSAPDGAAMI